MAKKTLASNLKNSCDSIPEDYEQKRRDEACPVSFAHGRISSESASIPLGKSVWVDFYPSGLYIFPPAGHDSPFPLFRDGGRSLSSAASILEQQWSRWRAGIEYCLRKKWNHPEIKAIGSNYDGRLIARVSMDGMVQVLSDLISSETNVDVIQLVEDLSFDPLLKFPVESVADFVELHILLADYNEPGLGGVSLSSGIGPAQVVMGKPVKLLLDTRVGKRRINNSAPIVMQPPTTLRTEAEGAVNIAAIEAARSADNEAQIDQALVSLNNARGNRQTNPQELVISLTNLAFWESQQKNTTETMSLCKEALAAFANIPPRPNTPAKPLSDAANRAPKGEFATDWDDDHHTVERWSNATEQAGERIWGIIQTLVTALSTKEFSAVFNMAMEVFAKAKFADGSRRYDIQGIQAILREHEAVGKTADAIDLLKNALATYNDVQPTHIHNRVIRSSLLGLYERQEDFEKAENLALEILDDLKNQSDLEAPYLETLLALSEIYRNEYKYDDARATLFRALTEYLSMTKPNDLAAANLARRLLDLEWLEDVDKLIRHAYAVKINDRTPGVLASVGAAFNCLIQAYTNKKMFAEAESLLAIVRRQDGKDGNRRKWNYLEANLYLRHAAELKREGQTTAYLELLARSIAAFNDCIELLSSQQPPNKYIPMHETNREEALQSCGFDSNDLAAAAKIMVPYRTQILDDENG